MSHFPTPISRAEMTASLQSEPPRTEGINGKRHRLANDHLRHQPTGQRTEKDPVSKMAGGDVEPVQACERTDEGQTVLRVRPKPSPRPRERLFGQSGDKGQGEFA